MALATARVKLSENLPTVRSTSKTEETWDGGVEEQQSNRAEEQRSSVEDQWYYRSGRAAEQRYCGAAAGREMGHFGGHQVGQRTYCNALGQTIKCPNIWKKGNSDQSPNFLLPGKVTGVQLLLNISNL